MIKVNFLKRSYLNLYLIKNLLVLGCKSWSRGHKSKLYFLPIMFPSKKIFITKFITGIVGNEKCDLEKHTECLFGLSSSFSSWLNSITDSNECDTLSLFTLREKCPCLELFLSAFSRIWTEYREIRNISRYLVQMQQNVDQDNS